MQTNKDKVEDKYEQLLEILQKQYDKESISKYQTIPQTLEKRFELGFGVFVVNFNDAYKAAREILMPKEDLEDFTLYNKYSEFKVKLFLFILKKDSSHIIVPVLEHYNYRSYGNILIDAIHKNLHKKIIDGVYKMPIFRRQLTYVDYSHIQSVAKDTFMENMSVFVREIMNDGGIEYKGVNSGEILKLHPFTKDEDLDDFNTNLIFISVKIKNIIKTEFVDKLKQTSLAHV